MGERIIVKCSCRLFFFQTCRQGTPTLVLAVPGSRSGVTLMFVPRAGKKKKKTKTEVRVNLFFSFSTGRARFPGPCQVPRSSCTPRHLFPKAGLIYDTWYLSLPYISAEMKVYSVRVYGYVRQASRRSVGLEVEPRAEFTIVD
jgi:hypothetical protein